jgi:hypothetical protein
MHIVQKPRSIICIKHEPPWKHNVNIANNQLEGVWREASLTHSEVVTLEFAGRTKENQMTTRRARRRADILTYGLPLLSKKRMSRAGQYGYQLFVDFGTHRVERNCYCVYSHLVRLVTETSQANSNAVERKLNKASV